MQVSEAAMNIQELGIAFDDENLTDTFVQDLEEAIKKAKEAKLPMEELEKALNAVKKDKSEQSIRGLGVALKGVTLDTKTTTTAIKNLSIKKVGQDSEESAERLRTMGNALDADA